MEKYYSENQDALFEEAHVVSPYRFLVFFLWGFVFLFSSKLPQNSKRKYSKERGFIKQIFIFKGSVSVISSEPPSKDGNVLFSMVALKP